jgi:hypothetical protein
VFVNEEKVLGKWMCRYLCSMDILYGSHSMHYNYSLLNISLCARNIYIYIYIYIYVYNPEIYAAYIYIYTIILSVLSIFRKPFLKLRVQYAYINKLSHFLYKVVMWNWTNVCLLRKSYIWVIILQSK